MGKPVLITHGGSYWVTDWITRRGIAPEDIALLDFMEQVQLDPGGKPVEIPVTTTVLERIVDVSPGTVNARFAAVTSSGTSASPAAIAKAVNDDAARRLAS